MDILILKAFEIGLYYQREINLGPIMIDGEEVTITPPSGPASKVDPESIEHVHLNYNTDFVKCSSLFAKNSMISIYHSNSSDLGRAKSSTKLSGFYKLLEPEDYQLISVKYFVAIDVILQKMIHVNRYTLE